METNREHDQAEIRLMGLILTQAVSIGIAVGVFDAELWIDLDNPTTNGVTYAMAAFAVQGLAYYLFKMFFQQGMDERARMAAQERERRKWMEDHPGETPPWIEARMYGNEYSSAEFVPETPKPKNPLTLGVDFSEDKKEASGRVRGSDGKFKKKE